MFYSRTDLACEAIPTRLTQGDFGGITIDTRSKDRIEIIEVNVLNELGARVIKRDIGKYVTICCGRAWLYEKEFIREIEKAVSFFLYYHWKHNLCTYNQAFCSSFRNCSWRNYRYCSYY